MLAAVGLLLNVSRGGSAGSARSRRAAMGDCASSTAAGAAGASRARAREELRAVPRVVIAAGGTAGHVVPALAVADALRAEGAEVSFLGAARPRRGRGSCPAAGYEIDLLRRPRPRPRQPAAAPRARCGWRPPRCPAARRVLRERGAEAVLGGGGYVAGPAGLAALSLRPAAGADRGRPPPRAHQPDARPPRAPGLPRVPDRGPRAARATWSPAARCPAAIVAADREAARERGSGSRAGDRCLLVFGGSQGARSINLAALEAFAGPRAARARLPRPPHQRQPRLRRGPRARSRRRRIRERYTLLDYEPGPRRRARRLRPGARPRRRLDLRDRRRRAAGDPRPLSPRRRPTTSTRTREWMAAGGAAVVIEDAELDPARLRELAADLLGDRARLGGDGARPSRALARPDAAERVAAELLGAIGEPVSAMSSSDWSGRELHFIAIGGAGMSGLALVCARARRPGHAARDRAESSYLQRLRDAGLEPRVGHDADAGAGGRRGRRLDRDRRRQPRAGAGARARPAGDPPRRAARRALRAAAADRRRRHPRQDDDRRDAGPRAARDRRRPRLLPRRRAARRRARRRGRRTPAGGRGSGWSPRPTSRTAASSSCGPRSP